MAGSVRFYLLQVGEGTDVHPRGTILEGDSNQLPAAGIVPNQVLLATICMRPRAENCTLPTEVTFQPNELQILNELDFRLLVSIKSVNNRWAVYQNAEWMDEGRNLQKGHKVNVTLYDESQAVGTVRYVGELNGYSEGIYFGIELDPSYEGRGTSDGCFGGVRHFTCKDNCGVFCNLSKIRVVKKSPGKEKFSKPEEDQSVLPIQICEQKSRLSEDPHQEEVKPTFLMPKSLLKFSEGPLGGSDPQSSKDIRKDQKTSEASPLSEGERVVHLTDSGAELATVKWIGALPGKGDKIFAGVQFDNPVGTGTGKFGEIQYFRAERGYASFIPLEGLIKAEDMIGAEPKRKASDTTPKISLEALMQGKLTHSMSGVIDWRGEFKSEVSPSRLELDSTFPLSGKTGSLPDDEGSENVRSSILVVSLLPIVESFKESPQSPTQMDCLRQLIYRIWKENEKLGCLDAQAVLDLKNILVEIYSLKLPGDESILTTSVKLFGICYELDRVRSMLVKAPDKYVQLEDVLRDSEEISSFSNHFLGTSVFMVAVGETTSKNRIIPSPALDFTSIFLSCRSCKENLHCPKCKPNKLPAFVCKDCLAETKSLRLSLFCMHCFQVFHQNCNLQHFEQEQIDTDEFEKASPCKQLNVHSQVSDRESCVNKMELFAIVSSVGGVQRIFGKTGLGKDAGWFLLEQSGMKRPLPELATFLKGYSTSPSTCFDPIFQEMLDGLKICYYRPCADQ